jgi:hypothetical protein
MVKPREFFISYAREDEQIATALAQTLRQIDDTFVVVNMDKVSLQSGINFREQLESKLQRSEVLFVVYTETTKPSFSYTGWEVGYFEGVHREDKSRIISLYLSSPPPTTHDLQGIALNITNEDLRVDTRLFESRLSAEVNKAHPMVRFMDDKRLELAVVRKDAGLPACRDVDTVQCVRDMLLSIFHYRKTAPDTTIKPQKQITIRTDLSAFQASYGDLPPDAELIPVGSGTPMSVFGLQERPITWADFCKASTDHELGPSWVQAIRSVVQSSFPNQINVDNSQIVLSPDNHIYRLILTMSTTYFNGRKEINLYLVESLKRADYGDPTTTRLLKGLALACRFRFMFLEQDSRFYAKNLQLMSPEQVRIAARDMLTELNLLHRDAREAGLHEPSVWAALVSWDLLLKMGREWHPRDLRVRAVCAEILALSKGQPVEELRKQLVDVIDELENIFRPLNTQLIVQMAAGLQRLVSTPDSRMAHRESGMVESVKQG